jgi:hypothetical protein
VAEFSVPLDIGNRAVTHCGLPLLTSFTADVKASELVNAVYDKLRAAELRRNVWRYSIRKTALRAVDTTTMFLIPGAYVSADTYPMGSIVTSGGTFYFAAQYVPAATAPGTPNEAYWTVYFGPKTVTPYDSEQTYYAGELVYNEVAGVVSVYQCLTSGTENDPTEAAPAWDSTVTYMTGDTVTYSSAVWQSKTDLNTNNTPAAGAFWQSVPVTNQGATQIGQDWLQITATVRYQRFQYPIGAGPHCQTSTRNVFRLPSGFLREAPQDQKAGVASYLGSPSGLPYDDWIFEGDFITTTDSPVIILRFVADIQDVSLMDPMFCEGLGARIGLEICEPLTQSDSKLGTISQIYKTFMGEARAINGIETGTVEPPLDDYISCRS